MPKQHSNHTAPPHLGNARWHKHRDALLILVSLLVGALIGHGGLQWTSEWGRSAQTGSTTGHASTAVVPSFNLSRTEANYHRQQQTAFQWLKDHPHARPTSDMWYLNGPFYECPGRRRIGKPIDGGKWVCAPEQLLSHAGCVVFSVGSRGETSFESALLAEFPHCQMHTFDPTLTPKVAAKVARVRGVTFHPLGIVGAKALRRAGANFTTLAASMAAADVSWIDVLKMDIEGSEWGVFLELLVDKAQLPFTQIQLEIHTSAISGGPAGPRAMQLLTQFFTGMHAAGYRVFSVEPNYETKAPCLEYAFVKVDGSGRFIRGA